MIQTALHIPCRAPACLPASQLGLGRVPSTAATLAARQAAAGAQPASPTQEAAEFLALARAGQGAVGGDASDSDGGRRRPGRASVLSKEGDSAQGWLNA